MVDDCENIIKARRGVDCPQHKLTPEDVLIIRECKRVRDDLKRQFTELSNRKLAEKFEVTERTIEKVVNRSSWSHI